MEAIIKTVQSQLQQKREQLASLKEKITSLKEQAISIEKEEKELCNLLQSLTQNLETTSEPIETSTNTQKQPEPVTSTSKTQQSSSPSPGEKEFMKREEDIEKILQNSSHGKQKWYVIFNGPFRGIYNDWAIASTHIIGKSVSHKSYLTKEAAEKALGESYKTVTTEEVQKSQQFVSLNQHLQSQTAKLNAINKMKNVPTTSEREEMRRPSVENFQRLWDSLISYNDVHTTMMFYPKKRDTGPKAVFFPQASSRDVYDYFIHGLVDSLYFHGSNPRELQEFPPKVQNTIKVYNDLFAKGREVAVQSPPTILSLVLARPLIPNTLQLYQTRVRRPRDIEPNSMSHQRNHQPSKNHLMVNLWPKPLNLSKTIEEPVEEQVFEMASDDID
ncbi:enzymatic polyprotein [Tanacetum coccineum]|uniref:Enzymatic polyprotein n=1 Tax=Tanacetum coccineum TaxID=301880 RepID=A0ABQ5HRU7_9ASTR